MPRPVLTIAPPYAPEMLLEAVQYVNAFVGDDTLAFEYGSGYSTVWLAQRVDSLVSVEHDPQWWLETNRALESEGLDNVDLVLVDHEDHMAQVIHDYGMFDLILVDCLDRQRNEAVKRAISHLSPGGLLVLDDSQWAMLELARKLLDATGWERVVFTGDHKRKDGTVRPHKTTIYRRPNV